ncbi:hypothetical protein BD779DRAFT_1668499 [Infundibulicybe gibba]|nr:hypothetical protein BD779DRAFT_1668499 [Infundibulicybe gibba]
MPTPLPRLNPFESTHLPLSHRAYHRCLDLEDRHTSVKMSGKLTVLICARFLGFMLVEAPVDAGREDFASEVVRCTDDEALQALANLYKNHLIRCFLHNKGRTPIPTLHPSGPSSDATTDEDIPPLRATPTNHSEAKQQALIRDRHRCILTGRIDSASLEAGHVVDDASDLTVTRASHIFNWPTNGGLEADNKRHYAASVLAMLSRFGKVDINELNGASIHRLQNVLTLDSNMHEWFGQLDIWLERRPGDPVDYYRLGATIPNFIRRVPAGSS